MSAATKKKLSHLIYPRSSSFYALANCSASFLLSQKSGEEPPTPHSDHGTEVHQLISGKIDPGGAEAGLREEADTLKKHQIEFFAQWLPGNHTEIRETRLWVRSGMKPLYSGEPDVWARDGGIAALSDFKTGWHPLDELVATNCQIRAYAGLIEYETKGELDQLAAAIHKPGAQLAPAVFDRNALEEALHWSIEVSIRSVEAAKKPESARPNRGPWCKFCSGKVLCPLWRDEVSSISQFANVSVTELPDSQLRRLAPRLALAAEVIERLQARLYERVRERPDFFTDWRFCPGELRRKVTDPVGAFNKLVAEKAALSPGEFLSCCRVAITELEGRLRRKLELTFKAAQALLAEELDGVMETKPARDKLVYNPNPESLTDRLKEAE